MSRSFVHRLRVEKKGFRRRRRCRRFFFFFFFLSYFLCSKRRRRHRSIDQSVLLRMHAGPFAEVQVVENGHVPQVQGQRVVLALVLVLVRIIDIIFLFFWNTPPNAIFFSVDSKCPPPPRSMFVFFFFSLRASASRSVESLERHERHSASTAKAESMTTMIFDASWIWCIALRVVSFFFFVYLLCTT